MLRYVKACTPILLALAFFVLAAPATLAQGIAGTWQGTLQNSRPTRLVLKISMSEGKTLKVDSYDLDNGAVRVPLNNVTFDGSTLKVPLTGHSGNYVGRMSADRNTIVGSWKQEDNSHPVALTFTRATPNTLWAIPTVGAGLSAMAKDAHPSFEVATIKPTAPGEESKSLAPLRIQGRYLTVKSISLLGLIQRAYKLQPRQILSAPNWANSANFDITGVPDTAGQPSEDQELEMYQKLLANRFKLSFRRTTKEFPVYALEPERDGPKLTKSSGDPNGPELLIMKPGANGSLIVTFSNTSMPQLARVLMQVITDQQVVDQTDLKGSYDFKLTFSEDPSAPDSSGAPDIYDAVQQQLGLKLQSTKAPVDVIVIDHAEPPTEN
jgi:uncharacterized protein (TIGR03435 family)